MPKTETLSSYLPNDYELIREVQADGKVVFKHSLGGEIDTIETDLYSAINSWIGRLQALVDLLPNDDYDSFGNIFEILLQNAEDELDEIFSFVRRSIGHIEIETVSRNSHPYRTGRVVAVSFAAPKEGGASS